MVKIIQTVSQKGGSMTGLQLQFANITALILIVSTFKTTTLFASSYKNQNEMLCDLPQSRKIQALNEIPEAKSENVTISELITMSATVKILMQKINTPNHLFDQYNMWLRKTAKNKPDQYFLIYTERSTGAAEFPIVMKSDIYPDHTFAYQTGFENYDTPNQFGRYKIIFQFKTPIQSELELERYYCVRPLVH